MNRKLYMILSISCTLAPFTASALDVMPINAAFRDDEGNYYDADQNLIVMEKPKPSVVLRPVTPRVDAATNTQNNRNNNKQNNNYKKEKQKEKPLVYNTSFYDSQGPRQGKMAIGGIMSQVAANVFGNIGAMNKNREMMTAAYGLQGMGEILSRSNDRRDPWGRFPGNPEYGRKPRNTNPQQPWNTKQPYYPGQGGVQPYGQQNSSPKQKPNQNFVPQNNVVQPPAVIPAQNRVPGTIRYQNQQPQQPNVPSVNPLDNKNKVTDNKVQNENQNLI